jgi:hypothetical protein
LIGAVITAEKRGRRHMSNDQFDIILVQAEAAKRGRASIWTVHDRPRDYPTGFVAKMFELDDAGPHPTQYRSSNRSARSFLAPASLACRATTATSRIS